MRLSRIFAIAAAVAAAAAGAAAAPLSLREALDAAAQQSPAIQLANLQRLEAELGVDRARAAYLPQANLTIGTAYQTSNLQGIGLVFPGIPSRIGPYRTFNARPVVTQTILDARLLTQIRAARERARAAGEEAAGTREAILYSVVQLYLQALEAGARVEAAEARVRTAAAVRKQAEDREQAGSGSKLDVERAVIQVEQEMVAAERARGEREALKTMLVKLTGAAAGQGRDGLELVAIRAPAAEPEFDAALARGLGGGRPEVRALETRLRADTLEVEAARRERLPKISGSADWGVLGAGPERATGTYDVGVAVTVPLWTGRRIETDLAAAAVRRRQTEQRLRELKLQVAQEVRQSEVESASALRAIQSARRAAAAARETLALVRLRLEAGLATSLDMAVAQGALAEAEEEEIRLRYQHLLARARLARAEGDVYSFLKGL